MSQTIKEALNKLIAALKTAAGDSTPVENNQDIRDALDDIPELVGKIGGGSKARNLESYLSLYIQYNPDNSVNDNNLAIGDLMSLSLYIDKQRVEYITNIDITKELDSETLNKITSSFYNFAKNKDIGLNVTLYDSKSKTQKRFIFTFPGDPVVFEGLFASGVTVGMIYAASIHSYDDGIQREGIKITIKSNTKNKTFEIKAMSRKSDIEVWDSVK